MTDDFYEKYEKWIYSNDILKKKWILREMSDDSNEVVLIVKSWNI